MNDALSKTKLNLKAQKESLPIFHVKDKIIEKFGQHDTLILVGETGSGKTTQVPQYISDAAKDAAGHHRIAVTQPRRVAAIALAKRVAEEMDVELGSTVGYSVRFDELASKDTRIKYVTDGMLLRETLSDPMLTRYGVVILDEAHERTLRTDILFGMIKRIQSTRRQKLKLIIMSATIKVEKFQAFFPNSGVFHVPGRQFPVKLHYTVEPQVDYLDALVLSIFQIHIEHPAGDILAFLTGQEEIESVQRILEDNADKCPKGTRKLFVCAIYASLPSYQQMKVFQRTPTGCRKVVLATNIAETSITIPGIRYVIDPGFVKIRQYHPRTGMESLCVRPVSKASSRQRCGRAGREAEGACFRLFTEDSFDTLEDETQPEIMRTNLSNVILMMKASGIEDIVNFDYLDHPSIDSLKRGLEELFALKALGPEGKLTPLGKQMAECPLIPQLSRVLLESKKHGCTDEIVTIVSMLSTDSIFVSSLENREQSSAAKRGFLDRTGDHLTLLNVFRAYQTHQKDASRWHRENHIDPRSMKSVMDIRSQLLQFCQKHSIPTSSEPSSDPSLILKTFVAGYFLQCAFRMADGSYRTALGKQTVNIHPSSVLFGCKPECIIFNELTVTSKCYMRGISVIQPTWLGEYAARQANTA